MKEPSLLYSSGVKLISLSSPAVEQKDPANKISGLHAEGRGGEASFSNCKDTEKNPNFSDFEPFVSQIVLPKHSLRGQYQQRLVLGD